MNVHHKRLINTLLTCLTVFSLVLNLALPAASLVNTVRAQETTAEPPLLPTPEATPAEIPGQPPVETTAEATEPPVLPTAEVTPEPAVTDTATELPPPAPDTFADDFQDGNTEGWLLTPGWTPVSDNGNLFLTTAETEQTATIANFSPADFTLSARLRLEAGKTASVAFRSGAESYSLTLDSNGNAVLYRGVTLLAQSTPLPPPPDGTPALWHTLNLQTYGSLIVVTVNGTPQIVYNDPSPLPAGNVVFSAPLGGVSLDEVNVNPLTAPIEPPVIPTPPAPTATAEVTPETSAEPEVTPEITPEATLESDVTPEATVEAEVTPEATVEPSERLVLSADFEGDLTGWTLGENTSIVLDGETNHALLMPAGSSLFPASALELSDFRLEARLNLTEAVDGAPSGVSIPFRVVDGSGYVLSFDTAQTALYRNDMTGSTPLASVPAAHAPNTWHTLELTVQGGQITVLVNGVPELDYTDAAPLPGGEIAFAANASTLLDDIAIYIPAALLENATPTPVGMALSDEEKAKLSGAVPMVLELWLSGQEEAALELANAYYLPFDEQGNLRVVIWSAEGATGEALLPMIAAVGGVADTTNADNVEARVPLNGLVALVNAPQVQLIAPVSTAVSTGVMAQTDGTITAEGYDILGVKEWHDAGIKGTGQTIAVIDTGFKGVSTSGLPTTCLPNRTVNNPTGLTGEGDSNHGTLIARMICDIAPNAPMKLYRAEQASHLANRITAASADNSIILVTLDLGADASPGDGTGGGQNNAVYTAITNARNAGDLVIVSAGNSYGRYASFQYSGTPVTLTIKATASDIIRVRWTGTGVTATINAPPAPMPFTTTSTSSGYFTVPNVGPCSNDYLTGETVRNYCDLTLNISGAGSGYVQVQVQTSVTVPPTYDEDGITPLFPDRTKILSAPAGANLNSSIGRPADSPNVLTVGAVCAEPALNLPIQTTSSRGPIFSSGGGAPAGLSSPAVRTNYKPDLMGVSDLATDTFIDEIPTQICDSDDTYGFAGTSGAAAHVAAMAALIRSNPNLGITTREGVINYLQSHTSDMYADPATEPDGFDMATGAGLTILGNPVPDYPISVDKTSLPPPTASFCPSGTAYFVQPTNLDADVLAGNYGTFANPFVHIGQAIASRTSATDCVILLPGEYVAPINVEDGQVTPGVRMRSYDAALNPTRLIDQTSTPDSIIWETVNGIGDSGGVYISADNFTLEGFRFIQAAHAQTRISSVVGVDVIGSSGAIIRNNIFADFTGGQPIRIDPDGDTGSQGIVIESNTFRTNHGGDTGAAIGIYDSSGDTNPIIIQFNNFIGNITDVAGAVNSAPVIFIQNGAANIYNNRFFKNDTNGLIRVENTEDSLTPGDDDLEVSLFGNAFIDNENTGPVIHLVPGRTFRFINNTVGGSTEMDDGSSIYSAVILRGKQTLLPHENGQTNGLWEIHNNLFYGNDAVSLIKDFEFVSCSSITDGYLTQTGAKNNWLWDSGGITGVCENALGNAAFNNRSVEPQIIGASVPNNPYQLVKTASSDPEEQANDGVDDGDNALASPGGIWYSDQDVLRRSRVESGTIDVGAYEYRAIGIVDIVPEIAQEDATVITFEMDAEGGFAPYTFTINPLPILYDTDPNNLCGGNPIVLQYNPATEKTTVKYCPPKNLYTEGAPAESQVTLNYTVRDRAGTIADTPGTITLRISETDDLPLAEPILQTVTVEVDPTSTPIQFQLRPFVSFDDNFFYSEDGGVEDVLGRTNTPGADYPYTYSYVGGSLEVLEGGGFGITDTIISDAITAANTNQDSVVLLTANGGAKGKFRFRYTESESPSVEHIVNMEIVPSLPYTGLHDDTSFSFSYDNAWTPLYSEGNINNTLHQAKTKDAEASFRFVGTGFALYMQGATTGNYWELQVDGQPFSWEGSKTVTRNQITCRTTAATGVSTATLPNNGKYISNRQATAYTVTCNRLRQGISHTVTIINRTANAPLNIDAIGILTDNTVLLPGFHEVRESQMLPLFLVGWNEITDKGTSNGIAMATSDPNVADVIFTFKGTGFAIGTALQQTLAKQGATYKVCFAKAAGGSPEVCSDEFNNATGATSAPIWNTFRPFFGFDPNVEHQARIDITSIPTGGRMVIDSIVIFDRQPTNVLPMGTTEDTNRTDIIFGGGLEDTWTIDTNNTRTSGGSLTSIVSTVTKAGPFISFQIPEDADSFSWWRYAATTDSQYIMVCVDRAQLDAGDGQTTFCVPKQLRSLTAPIVTHNPLIVSETDFTGGWGTAKNGAHTVEIFSLTNQPFNLDRLQVLSSTAPLTPSSYEQTVPNLCYFDDDQANYPCNNGVAPESSVTSTNNVRASGGSVAFIKERNEGVFFRFTGTGFSTLFTMDARGGNIQICWRRNSEVNEATKVADTLAGTCRQFNNYSAALTYQAARTITGLEDTTYAAVIQHIGAADWVSATSGNSMQVDAVVVYGDRWQDLNQLTPLPDGGRYETSFANQAANRQFNYLGGVWKSVSGTAARSYSGQNYDQVRAYGAGIVFRTNGADTVRLYRDIRASYAPLRLCYAPHTAGFALSAPPKCVDIRNDGGTAYQSAFNVNLGSSGQHVVSITTLNAGIFNLDAIELLNNAALQPGLYTETAPGLVYSLSTDDNLNDTVNGWRNIMSGSYLDKAAMQSTTPGASVEFSFTGTGFSLFTLVDSTSSNLVASLDGVSHDYLNIPITGSNARLYYGHTHTIAGLPLDTYQVTITEDDATRNKFTIDGVQIYGAYPPVLVPSIYDDNALNTDGSPVFNFGPSNAAWTSNLGTRAPSNLNRSNHTTNRIGATISFAVTNANAITLHHIGSTSTKVQFCVTPAAGARTCQELTLVGSNNTTFNLGALPGNYQVSITNLTPSTNLIVDAISVLNTTGSVPTMRPGIYQENSSLLGYGGTGSWNSSFLTEASATDKRVKGTTVGNPAGQTLSFTFNGTGFSIVLAESTTTSSSYTLTIEGAGALPLTNAATSTARAPSALTYVGFAPGEYDVVLTNNDPTKPLLVDRVDILGNVTDVPSAVTGGVENTDPRIVYFPYFSFVETAATAASGGSQHVGSMRGSVAYFELNIGAFDYVRETKSSYGQVTICTDDLIPNNGSTDCTPATITNNVAPFGFQQAANAAATNGGWTIIRNADGKPMPLDFVRPTGTAARLTAGYYEDTFTSGSLLRYVGTFTQSPVVSASGGFVHQTTTVEDAVLFDFNGTGFSVYFTLDAKADAVKICWASGTGLNLAQTQAGKCQTYDNQSAATRYRAARTILGLSDGDYTASVQMLEDNGTPAPHALSAQPVTMQVDAIQIYDEALPANVLGDAGTRYETSFANRVADGRFLYYGQGWRSVSGTAARTYSGQNYDTIANVIGAGLTFRTNNANSITLYRTFGAAAPALEVCAQRVDNGSRTCTTVNNKTGSGAQPTPAILLNQAGYVGQHIVSIVTLEAGTFTLDAIEIGNSNAHLQPGLYEDVHPALKFANGVWTSIFGASYSGGQAQQTSINGATVEFSFTNATGFAVGTTLDTLGGQVEVCYDTNATWGSGDKCYTYQNKGASANYNTSRAVTGLATGSTYYVRVRNLQAARLTIDYVRIFGEALPPAITAGGYYGENAVDSGGNSYLQLLPANRWNTFTGTAARGFNGGSYAGVVDNNKRLSSAYAGPVATLRVVIPAGTNNTTIVLYTGTATSLNPAEVLVCANDVTDSIVDKDCVKVTSLKTTNQIVVSGADLTVLGSTGAGTTVNLSFRALVPGYFRIDSFQVVYGTTLVPGIYDNFLAGDGGLLDTGTSVWPTMKSARALGGTLIRTQTQNAAITFDFSGTGFSVLTQADRYGADFSLCYALKDFFDGSFDGVDNSLDEQAQETCQPATTNTLTTGTVTWQSSNGDRLNPITAYQYGFAVHGLPSDVYTAEVRHTDTTRLPLTGTRLDWLQVDAVVIFGAPDASLAAGQIYDDTNASILYSPADFWTLLTARYGPSRGPWDKTEHNTTSVGAIAQFQIQGNTLVLYQTASTRGSRKVRICVTTSDGEECSDFSQNARTTYFTPIAFYGLGKAAEHDFVIENWDYGRILSIDALQVLP